MIILFDSFDLSLCIEKEGERTGQSSDFKYIDWFT